VTDPHDPATTPPCVLCDKRAAAPESQACTVCYIGLDTDLAAIPDLDALLPAAVAPSLSQPVGRTPHARETPMPGGEALNLTAPTNAEVPLRWITKVRIVPDEIPVIMGGKTVTVIVRRRETILDEAGRPLLVPDGDQHGDVGPWLMVSHWTAQWAALRDVGEVSAGGIRWLRERLDWACAEHPDLPGWAGELRHVVGGMRAILAVKSRVERFGNRCPACNNAGTLFRVVDPMMDREDRRTKYINCGVCPALFEVDDERITQGRVA
jgi:hypothetical protein